MGKGRRIIYQKRFCWRMGVRKMSHKYTKIDIIKDVIFFFITTAVAYGYILLMLLIISFIANRLLHLTFDNMLIYSGIGAAVVAVWYIVKKIMKYRKA